MKSKLKKWLIVTVVLCCSLFLIGYCFRDFWLLQLRIYVLGLTEVRADEYGYRMPEVDEIEVMSLEGSNFGAPSGPDRVGRYKVAGSAVLRGEDAERVAKLWRSLRRGRGFSAMCHEPIYALRFRRHGTQLFETTICWHCHNYTIPLGGLGNIEYGFDSKGDDALALLSLLESVVPQPTKPPA